MLEMEIITRAVRDAAERYPVRRVYLFGSYVEGTATAQSDVDLYVEFSQAPLSFFKFCGFRDMLMRAMGRDVDVVKTPPDPGTKMVLIYEA